MSDNPASLPYFTKLLDFFINYYSTTDNHFDSVIALPWSLLLNYPALDCLSLLITAPASFLPALDLAATLAAEKYLERIQINWLKDVQLPQKSVQLLQYNSITKLKYLKPSLVGKFVSVKGTVVSVSLVKPLISQMVFTCALCRKPYLIKAVLGKFKPLSKCSKLGCLSKSFVPDRTSNDTIYLQVNSIEKIEEDDEIRKDTLEFSDTDLQGILEIYNFEGLVIVLIILAALLLTIFGGRQRSQSQSTIQLRPDPHILVVGDPGISAILILGLGKSQLLLAAVNLSPRGVYATGSTSTTAAFTANVSKDSFSGDTILEAGYFPLADQGLCCIDEFDKLKDYNPILQILEEQAIAVSKNGFLCSMPCRTSVVAAANPTGGHYDKTKTIVENLKMNEVLLSRFDLIFVMLDKADQTMDRFLSDHIMKIHSGKRLVKQEFTKNENGEATVNSLSERLHFGTMNSDPIPTNLLRKYISYARTYCQPKLTNEAAVALQELNEAETSDGTPITTRYLESMLRLSEARARSELRDNITPEDVSDIFEIFKYSLFHLNDEVGQLVQSKRKGGGSSKQAELKLLLEGLRKTSNQTGSSFTYAQIVNLANQLMIKNDVTVMLETLNHQGALLYY
ncbi:DNA replication licensing factor mcm8 [Globomyces sp. JEL0801]|nr:DNA replication licensing factor mcm8 [Globomyces sp. JEL0801]